jgi:hypothetical protein
MTMLRKILALVAAGLLVVLVVFFYAERFSSSFQSCIGQQASAAAYARCTVRFTDSHNGIITALATVLLMVVTAGLMAVGYMQITTTRAQLRAYVTVKSKNLFEPNTDEKLTHDLEITNRGQTPAYKLRIISETRVLSHPITANTNLSIKEIPNPSVMMLGPGDTVAHTSATDKLDPKVDGAVTAKDGGKRLYTYGIVHYRDIFRREWKTEFCYFVEILNLPDGKIRMLVHPSEYHNDAT